MNYNATRSQFVKCINVIRIDGKHTRSLNMRYRSLHWRKMLGTQLCIQIQVRSNLVFKDLEFRFSANFIFKV